MRLLQSSVCLINELGYLHPKCLFPGYSSWPLAIWAFPYRLLWGERLGLLGTCFWRHLSSLSFLWAAWWPPQSNLLFPGEQVPLPDSENNTNNSLRQCKQPRVSSNNRRRCFPRKWGLRGQNRTKLIIQESRLYGNIVDSRQVPCNNSATVWLQVFD